MSAAQSLQADAGGANKPKVAQQLIQFPCFPGKLCATTYMSVDDMENFAKSHKKCLESMLNLEMAAKWDRGERFECIIAKSHVTKLYWTTPSKFGEKFTLRADFISIAPSLLDISKHMIDCDSKAKTLWKQKVQQAQSPEVVDQESNDTVCLLYTSPSPRD